jgi:crotonobetainyl-CoA:carnitine CoA-transferase CaiB-like acyl-CoA transferase
VLDDDLATFTDRFARRHMVDEQIEAWTRRYERRKVVDVLKAAGVPAEQVATPEDRIENDPRTSTWNLWPWVHHDEIGDTRVEGIPIHMSESDWSIARGAPCLGDDNEYVYGSLLGLSEAEITDLGARGVI